MKKNTPKKKKINNAKFSLLFAIAIFAYIINSFSMEQEQIKQKASPLPYNSKKNNNSIAMTPTTQLKPNDKNKQNHSNIESEFDIDRNTYNSELHQSLECQLRYESIEACNGTTIDELHSKYKKKYTDDFKYEYILARLHPIKYRESTIHMMMASTWDKESENYIKDNITSMNISDSERFFLYSLLEKTSEDNELIEELRSVGYHIYQEDDYNLILELTENYINSNIEGKRAVLNKLLFNDMQKTDF
ncbi:MAG: hypothetical protein KJ556_16165 [Gammaproteobacteria bacterium]|nr:hypothetical protein [Gammaproteobacteria bacterium]MBU2058295.1 hypothetical protein [Gammaproteobacteria bacterium]MBU2176652.1 hypothetical protein [Gammaproteobacteria bacterium]MBU2248406.1 hypothetical protein [Gammaproteobacteria bacterium]MBU2345731.1 hypothetical protein [Gammaproteobacteria bacterium]